MLSLLFLSSFLTLALMMFIATTPLQLGVLILFYALAAAIWFTTLTSSWFGLMMFMIYVGGMLVMFAYFVAITPNQNITIMPMMMTMLLSMPMLYKLLSLNTTFTTTFTTEQMHQMLPFLFTSNQGIILIFMLLMLLLALVIVVKISNREAGPLRPFSK